MGLTHITAELRDISGAGDCYSAEFLVDTGALDCRAPGSELRRIGVVPAKKAVYELATGQPVELDVGYALVTFLGDETVTQVVFGPDDCEPLLGVIALENAGIMVDPTTQTLKRLHARPMKCFVSRSLPSDRDTDDCA